MVARVRPESRQRPIGRARGSFEPGIPFAPRETELFH